MVRVRGSQAAAGSSRKRGLPHFTGKQRNEERPVKKNKSWNHISQHWNDENFKDRIDEERESGGFGLGIFKLEGYPISKEEELKEEVQRTITYKLHRLFDDDATLEFKYPQEFDRAVAKMNRDLAVICELRFTELESAMDQALSYNTSTSKAVTNVLICNIDTVIKEMQNIRCKLHARQCLETNAPNGPKKHNVDEDGSDSDDVDVDGSKKKVIVKLIDTETDDDEVCCDGDADDDQGVRQCLKTSAPKGTPRKSCEKEGPGGSKKKVIIELSDTEIDNDPDPDPNAAGGATSNLIKVQPEAGQLAPHPQENDDFVGISVQKGTDTMSSKPNCDVLDILKATSQDRFLTKLLRTYPFKMNNLQNYEAQIADFCISRSKDFHATFPMFNDTIPNVQDFNSLELAEDISTFIIISWARVLNAAQLDPDKPSRLCLKAIFAPNIIIPRTVLFKGWDLFMESCSRNVLSADLVFVPVHIYPHYFLLVVNFKERLVQYLDNLRHGEDVVKEYHKTIERVKNVVALYLEHHQHPEAKAVKEYELKTIEGKWRTREFNHDSGVYVMYHMDTFTGKSDDIDESPVMKADSRNELRAKFCARLILSPVNTCTRSVLSGVSSFNDEKANGKITY